LKHSKSIKQLFILSIGFKAVICSLLVIAIILYWFKVSVLNDVSSNFWILGFLLIPGIAVPLATLKKVRNENFKKQSLMVFAAESLFTALILYAVPVRCMT